MFSKLNELSNYATFANEFQGNSWDGHFEKNNIIFGGNGTGKTSFSLIFRSLELSDNSFITKKKQITNRDKSIKISFDLDDSENDSINFNGDSWDRNIDNIRVFNSFYENKNIYKISGPFDFLDNYICSTNIDKISDLTDQNSQLISEKKLSGFEAEKLNERIKYDRTSSYTKQKKSDDKKKLDKIYKRILEIKYQLQDNKTKISYLYQQQIDKFISKINDYLSSFTTEIKINQGRTRNYSDGKISSIIFNIAVKNINDDINQRLILTEKSTSFDYLLSDGDKRSISFAIFLAKLDFYGNLENTILVIDDPFTSFDRSRENVTLAQILRLSKIAKQTFILTHNKSFAFQMDNKLGKDKIINLQIKKAGGFSKIETIDLSEDVNTDIINNLNSLNDYVNGKSTKSEKLIQEDIRRALEGVFKIKFYKFYKPKIMLGKFVHYIKQSKQNAAYQEFSRLQSELDELQEIMDYTNSSHHDNSQNKIDNSTDSEELRAYVIRTLELIKKI